jgi:hypothetical protein
MTFSNIFAAISLGRKVISTITDLRRDIHSVRLESAGTEAKTGHPEALESRLGDIEFQAREQHARVITLEQSLNEVLRATEALAERLNTTFWIASVACGLALIGVIVSVVALARTFR